jgi:hypothetical protein
MYGMKKTTVYLSDELKRRLERTAREQNRSEADVIRAGIELATASDPPRPRLGLFNSGRPIEDWDEALAGFGED